RVAEECGQGDVCAWVGWRLAIEESANEPPYLLRGQPADPHRGAAAPGHREIVPGTELRNLALQGRPQEVRITEILRRRREVDRADQGCRGACNNGDVVREIDQHGSSRRFEQLQGSP